MYDGSDRYAFDVELDAALGREKKRRKLRELVQANAEGRYTHLFAEHRLRPRGFTYGYGYPVAVDGPAAPFAREAEPYDKEAWEEIRDVVLRRDKFTCRRCNTKKTKADLSAHHIVPRSEAGDDKGTNLLSLCHPCHDIVECHEPPLRNRAAIVGSYDDHPAAEYELAKVREEVADWGRKRKPHLVIARLANQLDSLGLMPKAVADELGISDALLRTVLRAAA